MLFDSIIEECRGDENAEGNKRQKLYDIPVQKSHTRELDN